MTAGTLRERIRARLLALMLDRGFQQKTLATATGLSTSHASKLLSGKTQITLDHLEQFCFALQVTPSELTAEPGALILPVSPLESALLDRFRRMSEHERLALMTVLDWRLKETPKKKRR